MEVVTRTFQNAGVLAFGLDALVKSLILLGAAGAICLVWRRGAASTRHRLWSLAVVGCLAVPVLSWVLPASPRPLWALRAGQSASNNEMSLAFEFAPSPNSRAALAQTPGVGTKPSAGGTHHATHTSQVLRTRFGAGWAASAITAWLGGAVLCLLWMAVGRLRLTWLRRLAQAPDEPNWLTLLQSLCQEVGISRRVVLLQSAENVMPVTWGWWRPVILLPAEAQTWTAERLRVVLLHELAHVKRWDCLTQMLGQFVCALYWLNPLAWVAARQMRIERERACDDLVLDGGCKASDYASHLVELAQAFRPIPQVAAIAMARSSNLEGRIEAIVDASRVRRGPPALLLFIGGVIVLGLVGAVSGQQREATATNDSANGKPWFDARLRAFFSEKAAQARELTGGKTVAPEVWPYFEAGINGDWSTATNLWVKMRQRAHQYEGAQSDDRLNACWGPILETDLAWEQFANWHKKYLLAYGNDIINSIPPGSIYFGGTDPGRGVITVMSKSHAQADPFFTLTQNALADGTYLDYLRAMYGSRIYTPTAEDSKRCFEEYTADAKRRMDDHKLRPGEDVQVVHDKVSVSGQLAVMSINGLLAKVIFDHNTNQEFYVEESFPLDWMYPHLSPNGLIMRINREPLASLSEETVQADHEYWSRYLEPMLGNWLGYGTSVAELVKFVNQVYVKHDLAGFTGDPEYVQDDWAQKAYSKLRCSIGGVYYWRLTNTKNPEEKQRMTREADFALRQAYALCPISPEALFRYVNLLVSGKRIDDAILLAETTLKLDPKNEQVKSLLQNLRSFKKQQ